MQHLRAESYSPEGDGEFPESGNALVGGEGFRQRFGFARTAIALGLLASAALLLTSVRPLLSGVGAGLAVAAVAGLLLLGAGRRRAQRALVLVLRGRGLGVYREGRRADVVPLADVQHLGLYAGHVVTFTLIPLLGAALCAVGIATGAGAERLLAGVGALVFVAIAASNVFVRALCLHFYVPVGGARTRVLLARQDGNALLAAHPKTGGWRVTE